MGNGYKVRIYESSHKDGATGSGTVVLPVDPSFTITADSVEEVLNWIRTNVVQDKLSSDRVYQACPGVDSQELMSSVAVGPHGSFAHVLMDPVSGTYGQLRRVRDVETLAFSIDESPTAGKTHFEEAFS